MTGDIIRNLREEFDLKQEELAEKLTLSRFTISNHENGRNVRSDAIIKYARFFNVSSDYLLGLTQDRRRSDSDIAQLIDSAASATLSNAGTPIQPDQIRMLFESLLSYYGQGAPAGNVPIDVLSSFLTAYTQLIQAIGSPTAQLLNAINASANAGLSSTNILQEYLRRQEEE